MKYYKELLESTFGERCLTVYNIVDEGEESLFNEEKKDRIGIGFGERVKLRSSNISYKDHNNELVKLAKVWKILSLSPSGTRVFDRIVSVASANALLNRRSVVNEDDILVLGLIQGALVNPLSPHVKIVELASKGMTQIQVCEAMGKNPETYQPYVSKILGEYRRKGVLI